jgi:hypothetical protein
MKVSMGQQKWKRMQACRQEQRDIIKIQGIQTCRKKKKEKKGRRKDEKNKTKP